MSTLPETDLRTAAGWIQRAEWLVVAAGAGMGVDSGLPDFRGPEGFWQAYPPYRHLNMHFEDAANPEHFATRPALAWGFYGHRLGLYRSAVPHAGFGLILEWAHRLGIPVWAYTSNVDGQFQKAGYPPAQVVEIHGSIHHLQCTLPCSSTIWENTETIPVDTQTMTAQVLPTCPACGRLARPNILMFGDGSWLSERTDAQHRAFQHFLAGIGRQKGVVLEIGAGTGVPSIRMFSARMRARQQASVVQINLREPGNHADVCLQAGAQAALTALNKYI
jgi:NAD-dependent SIR2 family protein deacetylase